MRHSIGYLFKEGAKSLWKNRTMSLASIVVLISCLLLMGVAGLLSINLSVWMQKIEQENKITIYLKDTIPPLASIQVGEEIRNIENISESKFIPKDEGMKGMVEIIGSGGTLLEGLIGADNFLPDAYEIKVKDLSLYDATIKQVMEIEGTNSISDYSDTANTLSKLDRLVRYSSFAIVLALGIVSLFIISNTIKVTMFSRRMEINIMKSVGATNAFVRVPFIVEGIIIGIISGTTSAGILYLSYFKLAEVVNGIFSLLGGAVDITGIFWLVFVAYAAIGVLFGVLGCGISIGKYLKKEGENAIN
jgi:Cell division protein